MILGHCGRGTGVDTSRHESEYDILVRYDNLHLDLAKYERREVGKSSEKRSRTNFLHTMEL